MRSPAARASGANRPRSKIRSAIRRNFIEEREPYCESVQLQFIGHSGTLGLMKTVIASVIALLVLMAAGAPAEETPGTLPPVAVDLWKASGGDNWSKVKEIDFNFVVEQDGKQLFNAAHRWNVAAMTDAVKWKDKEGKDHDVMANLSKPATEGEEKTAFARW